MNKEIVIKSVFYAIVAFTLITFGSCRDKGGKGGIVSVAHNTEGGKVDAPTAIDIYVDASASMKGYVDGIGGTFTVNVPNLATNPTNKQNSLGMSEDSIKCYTIDNQTLHNYSTQDFRDKISDKSLFNGATTEIQKMFNVVADNAINNPNHVAFIISDCILSLPDAEIHANPEANIQKISQLEASVTSAVTRLSNASLSVAIVQYKSDFNGKYYYNYQDMPLQAAQGQILKDRPYYIIMIGHKNKIDAVFNKHVLPKDYTGVYVYNTECSKPKFHVIRAQKSGAISDVTDNVVSVKVNQKGPDAPYFYIGVEDFNTASYLDFNAVLAKPEVKGNIIGSIEPVEFDVVNEDKNIKKEKDTWTCVSFYKVTLKPNEELRNISDVKDEIFFKVPVIDAKKSEIVKDNVDDITKLQGKTFMFSHFIKAIENAYLDAENSVAKIEIEIKKISK